MKGDCYASNRPGKAGAGGGFDDKMGLGVWG